MGNVGTVSVDLVANTGSFETSVTRAAGLAKQKAAEISVSFAQVGESAAKIGQLLGVGFAAFGAEELMRGIFEETAKAQKIQAQLAATIASTGGAAGLGVGQLKSYAEQLAGTSTYGHLAIESAEALLLTFTKIGSTVFPEATKAVLDMSTALGTDLNETARQVGKALQDPEKGMQALRRVGVLFTADQKATIKSLEDTGNMAAAQTIILKQLEVQFGGSAAAARDTLGGALDVLKNKFSDLLENRGDGLFGDAAQAGIKLFADNLEHLADVAAAVGAVLAAKLVGGGAQAGFASVTAIKASIDATIADTAATAANTAAQVANAEQRVVAAAIRNQELIAKKALAAVTLENAAAQIADAKTVAGLDLATSSYARVANQAAAANGAYRASVIALTEAQAANTVAQSAATAAAGTGVVAQASKGVGGFALSLVGGPWGAAALAIGAVAFEFVKVADAAKRAQEATQAELGALANIPDQVREITAAYTSLNSTESTANFVKQWEDASNKIIATREHVKDLQSQLDALLRVENSPIHSELTTKLTEEIAQLTLQATSAQNALEPMTKVIQNLGPTSDEVRAHLQQLDDQDFSHLESSLAGFFSWFAKQSNNAIQNIDALRSAFSTDMGDLASEAAKYQKQIDDFGKNNADKARNDLNRRIAAIQAQPGPQQDKDAEIAALKAQGAAVIALAGQYDRLEASKKKAGPDKEAAAFKSITDQIKDQIAQDRALLDNTDKQNASDRLATKIQADLADGKIKLIGTHKAYVESLLAVLRADGLAVDMAAQQKKDLKEQADLQAKLNDLLGKQASGNTRALEDMGHGSQWIAERKAIEQITDAYQQQLDEQAKLYADGTSDLKQYVAQIGNIAIAEQKAISAQQKFFGDQKAGWADWRNGARSALQDFQDQSKNIADQVHAIWTNALNGITDAITNLITTGRGGFKALADSIAHDITHMFVQGELAKLTAPDGPLGGLFGKLGLGGTDYGATAAAAQTAATTANTAALMGLTSVMAANGALGAVGGSGDASSLLSSLFNTGGTLSSGAGIEGALMSWLPGFANGGAVSAGSPIVVGERGPEIFLPRNSGTIVPNSSMRGNAGSVVVNQTFNIRGSITARTAAQIRQEEMIAQQRALGRNR